MIILVECNRISFNFIGVEKNGVALDNCRLKLNNTIQFQKLMKKELAVLLLIYLLGFSSELEASAINVLVWDERQPSQSKAYENFIGNEICRQLIESNGDRLKIKSVSINDPEKGLLDKDLDWAQVLIWWGHVRQHEVTPPVAKKKVVERLKNGSLNLIVLHSAHWATPFMEAMNEKTKINAKLKYPDPEKGKKVEFESIPPPGRMAPSSDSVVTPAYYVLMRAKMAAKVRVDLPNCCFPNYRPDGKPSVMVTKLPDHPIAKGIPPSFKVKSTEMYNEPFHVPPPDQVVFEERWEPGEWFRSGMVWNIQKGKVFYFRPGHETFPVYKQPEIIQIIENAVFWLGSHSPE